MSLRHKTAEAGFGFANNLKKQIECVLTIQFISCFYIKILVKFSQITSICLILILWFNIVASHIFTLQVLPRTSGLYFAVFRLQAIVAGPTNCLQGSTTLRSQKWFAFVKHSLCLQFCTSNIIATILYHVLFYLIMILGIFIPLPYYKNEFHQRIKFNISTIFNQCN